AKPAPTRFLPDFTVDYAHILGSCPTLNPDDLRHSLATLNTRKFRQ
ncbi:MAG: hypothetical protein ACI80L_001694, partial [Pseudohongiellaceae bacterium]